MSFQEEIRTEFSSSGGIKKALLILLPLIALVTAMLVVSGNMMAPMLLATALFGLIVVYYCLVRPVAGFYLVTAISFMVAYPERVLGKEVPVSTAIEMLILLLFIGAFSIKKEISEKHFYRTPVSIAFFAYILFFVVEFFNPNMYSAGGWIFYMRRMLMFTLMYILSYRLLDSMERIKAFLKIWFVFALLAAAYGCFQQWVGLMPFEKAYLDQHPHEYKLYFQGGNLRKFSFLSDPTTFGIMAGSSAVFMLIIAINEKVKRKRNLYLAAFMLLMIGMSFSGTRTANIMLPSALCLYALMTITNKTTLITLFTFLIAAAFILFGPIQNNTINRIRSTFNSSETSVSVRDENRKYIQPYIYQHPLGGGIATSGVLGERYNPGHTLAGFPPDSGLVLAAIEIGWVGYALTILLYFILLYQSVHFYFQARHRENKLLIVALTASVFTIIITQYSQVAIGQLPTSLFFYSSFALITRLKELGIKT
jgi:hypothetical protein